MKKLAIILIGFYQKHISPLAPSSCRFVPSCSQYAVECIQKYGTFKGAYLATRRIFRCHPFSPGGYDPVK